MTQLASVVHLLPDDEIVSAHDVPFRSARPRLGNDLVIDLLTQGKTAMPVASKDIDGAEHQGLFDAEFPRDALIMAAFVADTLPQVTLTTIRRLSQLQGLRDKTEIGFYADREEPGRIPHEVRTTDDPRAAEFTRLHGWQWPYFGAIDTTPLYISAVVRAAKQHPEILKRTVVQSDGVERTIEQCLVASFAWLWTKLQQSENGLLETKAATNGCWQAWQDSPDAYHHFDGSLARGAVAPIEVQAYAYDALMDFADLLRMNLIAGDANHIWMRAQRLRRSIIENTWVISPATGGYFAAGVENFRGELRPMTVRTANMGLLLNSRLLDEPAYRRYVEAIVNQLFMYNGLMSGVGLRTLASDEKRFRPSGYHTGSVWPWQNLWIARGLRQHGFAAQARLLENKMRLVAEVTACTPEYVLGGDNPVPQMPELMVQIRSSNGNGGDFQHLAIQPAQHFQGWTAFGLYALERDHPKARESELGKSVEGPTDVVIL